MSRLIKFLMCAIALLLVGTAASYAATIDPITAFHTATANIPIIATSAAIVTASITPKMIEEAKLKFGRIQLLTVIVTQPTYDIDNLTDEQKAELKSNKVDVLILCNASIPIDSRLKELRKISITKLSADSTIRNLTGAVTDPAEQYQFIVKRPDRGLIKMLLPLAADISKLDDFADKAVKNLVIGGDLDALEDGLVYMGVVTQLKDLIQPAAAFLSNA